MNLKLLGELPQGLPAIGLPAIRWEDLNDLLPLALACFLLAAAETAIRNAADHSCTRIASLLPPTSL